MSDEIYSQNSEVRVESLFIELDDSPVLPGMGEGEIIVVRSARRKRNISAYRQGGQIVVSIPARLSKACLLYTSPSPRDS